VIHRRATAVALLSVVAMTIGCDQVSKDLARIHLMGGPGQSYLGDSIRLVYAENSGAFLSLGSGLPAGVRTAFFSFGTAVILAFCIIAIARHRSLTLSVLGLTLVAAGGVSNLADRVARGSVVDFLNVGIGSLRTGIFNVADMAILSGVALIVLRQWRRDPGGKPVERVG
jgi:signal peptidase II